MLKNYLLKFVCMIFIWYIGKNVLFSLKFIEIKKNKYECGIDD